MLLPFVRNVGKFQKKEKKKRIKMNNINKSSTKIVPTSSIKRKKKNRKKEKKERIQGTTTTAKNDINEDTDDDEDADDESDSESEDEERKDGGNSREEEEEFIEEKKKEQKKEQTKEQTKKKKKKKKKKIIDQVRQALNNIGKENVNRMILNLQKNGMNEIREHFIRGLTIKLLGDDLTKKEFQHFIRQVGGPGRSASSIDTVNVQSFQRWIFPSIKIKSMKVDGIGQEKTWSEKMKILEKNRSELKDLEICHFYFTFIHLGKKRCISMITILKSNGVIELNSNMIKGMKLCSLELFLFFFSFFFDLIPSRDPIFLIDFFLFFLFFFLKRSWN